ncbi:response regulator transcription factor [Neptunitalea lumnitzerae]|uniref:DNA-binding response regulator n=1 Tax=Neptunitalea lumnitzerae TaxID=2965509 RepID=A0ABQ5MJ93_9FLAO|nr:response regulator transcription factor [Neptunitalea sp. Y10]GLB49487.1 DNA-binding response regulator [Neptunitalea sp. Y10]
MKVLIVEDEPGILNFLSQGLREESYEVTAASNGIVGLEYALSTTYDIIILDWMLPNMSGIEICKKIRAEHIATPVLFLTAKDTLQDTILGLQSGANDYIKKPFHFEELLERIKVQLRPKLEHLEYIIGDIKLDTTSYQVFKNNEEISLTRKEFSLLEYLIKNKGKVCTRTNILDHVWDINFNYDSGVIDVFINALRKKLNISNSEYIHTIRGVGYMIKDE